MRAKIIEASITHPVWDALIDLEPYALDSAREAAVQMAKLYYAHLEKHNWDMNAACRVFYIVHEDAFRRIMPKGIPMSRQLADRLTILARDYKTDRKHVVHAQPDYREKSAKRLTQFIDETVEDAKANYLRFIKRLCTKIPVTCNVVMAGNMPWIRAEVMFNWEENGKDISKMYIIYQAHKISKFGNLVTVWREREVKFTKSGERK